MSHFEARRRSLSIDRNAANSGGKRHISGAVAHIAINFTMSFCETNKQTKIVSTSIDPANY
jgi:hypothetical protein